VALEDLRLPVRVPISRRTRPISSPTEALLPPAPAAGPATVSRLLAARQRPTVAARTSPEARVAAVEASMAEKAVVLVSTAACEAASAGPTEVLPLQPSSLGASASRLTRPLILLLIASSIPLICQAA